MKELQSTIVAIASILVIIVIHSILSSVSQNLGNSNISQVAFYVQIILIVTVIMGTFSETIKMVITTIQELVGFMHTLIPIIITLMLTTGNMVSSGLIQPVLIILMQFIGNIIIRICDSGDYDWDSTWNCLECFG